LRLVMTEQPGVWWPYLLNEMDSIHLLMKEQGNDIPSFDYPARRVGSAPFAQKLPTLPRRPSDYFRENVFVGASFLAHFEAEAALAEDMVSNIMWGSDYPHQEGTWQYREDEMSVTKVALQHTFFELPGDAVRMMAGENAARCYGLDIDELARVAEAIAAPTLQDLAERPADLPSIDWWGGYAFRRMGPWS